MSFEKSQQASVQEVNHTNQPVIVTESKEGRIITVVLTDDGVTVKEQVA